MTASFPEPYSLVLKGTGSSNGYANSGSNSYQVLPRGSNTVTVTTDVPVGVSVSVGTSISIDELAVVGTIPAGTGRRSVVISNLGVGEEETMYMRISRLQSTAPLSERCTVSVVTIPLKGAGGGVVLAGISRGYASFLRRWHHERNRMGNLPTRTSRIFSDAAHRVRRGTVVGFKLRHSASWSDLGDGVLGWRGGNLAADQGCDKYDHSQGVHSARPVEKSAHNHCRNTGGSRGIPNHLCSRIGNPGGYGHRTPISADHSHTLAAGGVK